MQRRTVIKQLALATGAIVLMPSCMQDNDKVSIQLKKIKIAGSQEKLLAELTETILPATDSPGAKDIAAQLFVLRMVDDCYKNEDQEKFMRGLAAFDKKADGQFGKSFTKCTAAEKETLVKELDTKKSGEADLAYFYNTVKGLTVQAYATSKFYLTNVEDFKLVPGRYKGCVPVKKTA